MGYNKKLRPKKHLKGCLFYGKFGKFDLSEGLCWDDFTNEMLEEFATVCNAKTVNSHLIGELPKAKTSTKKLSKKPSTDETPAEEQK